MNEPLSSRWGHPRAAGWPFLCAACGGWECCPLTVFAVALSPPRYLSFSELSHSSVRVSWEPAAAAVRAHHVTYVSGRGGNAGQVSPQGQEKGSWVTPCSPSAAWFRESLCAGRVLALEWALLLQLSRHADVSAAVPSRITGGFGLERASIAI